MADVLTPPVSGSPVPPTSTSSGGDTADVQYQPEVTNFAEQKNFNVINNYQIMYMPTNATHKQLYETYSANMWRMFLWSLVGELQTTPQIWNPTIMKGKVAKAQIFLSQPDVSAINGPQDTALISQLNGLIAKATVVAGN
jgi:hypothetical protein